MDSDVAKNAELAGKASMQLEVSVERLVGEVEPTQPLLDETSNEDRLEFRLEFDKLLV